MHQTITPIPVRPWMLNGISERILVSHYENEYGAAVRLSGRRQQDDIGLRREGSGDAVPVERRRDRHDEIIDPGQGIDHVCEFAKIQLAVAANRQKVKPRGRVAANDFGERGRAGKKVAERGFGARLMAIRRAGGGILKIQ